MHSGLRTALAAVVAGWLAAPLAGLPPPGEGWLEVRTEHFHLVSNAGERKAVEIGLRLERFRQVLARLKPGLNLSSPVPVTIVAFRNERSFAPYKESLGRTGEDLLGFFLSHRHGNFIGLNAFPSRSDALPVIYHEYVHFFVRHNFPLLPLWANEGLAEYYSTFGELAGEVQIGAPIPDHVRLLAGRSFIPFERFFAVDRQSEEYGEAEKKGAYYAQCWALVHYFLSGDQGQRRGAAEFLRLLGEGGPPEPALRQALGIGLVELETRLRAYVRARRFLFSSIALGELGEPVAPRVRALPRAEALCHLGALIAHAGAEPRRLAEAQAHFRAALDSDPASSEAHAGLAFVERERGRPAEAEALLKRAVSLGSPSARTLVLQAEVLLDALRQGGKVPEEEEERVRRALEARAAAERALALDPSFGEAELLAGLTYFYDPGDPGPGIARLEKAWELLPDRPEIVHNAALLQLRAGHLEAAAALVEGPLARLGDPELVRQAREAVARSRAIAEVNAAIAAGEDERAAALLRSSLAADSDPEAAAALAAQLERLESQVESNRLVGRYNRAVELANHGQLQEAVAELSGLLAVAPEGELRRAAEELLEELKPLVP